jgi:hypothetical protein
MSVNLTYVRTQRSITPLDPPSTTANKPPTAAAAAPPTTHHHPFPRTSPHNVPMVSQGVGCGVRSASSKGKSWRFFSNREWSSCDASEASASQAPSSAHEPAPSSNGSGLACAALYSVPGLETSPHPLTIISPGFGFPGASA